MILFDPKIFNYIIMVLYCANIARWLVAGSFGNAWYWSGALCITAAVTWGLNK